MKNGINRKLPERIAAAFIAVTLLSSCVGRSEESNEEPFSGIPAEDIITGFSKDVNNKAFGHRLFCYDGEGNIYFSDPQNGFRLCRYDGSRCSRITDFPAFGMDFWEGEVYFLTDDSQINLEDMTGVYGIPYKYDTASGSVLKIGDEPIQNMSVIDGEIYGVNMENECFVYKYDSGERLFNSFDIKKTGSYFLTFETKKNGIRFYLQSDSDRRLFIEDDIPTEGFFAFGKYYYRGQESHELRSVDLANGETVCYCSGGIEDFTVLKGQLYITASDGYLYAYKDGGLKKQDELNQYCALYSDNEDLYAVLKRYNASFGRAEYRFVKLDENFLPEILQCPDDSGDETE